MKFVQLLLLPLIVGFAFLGVSHGEDGVILPQSEGLLSSENTSTTAPPPPLTTTLPPTTTTTTKSPLTSTTTEHPKTTSVVPPTSTTPSPKPKSPVLGNYTVVDRNDDVCLVLVTRLTARMNDTRFPFGNGTVSKSNSSCNKTEIRLVLSFENEDSNVEIVFRKNNVSYFMSELSVNTPNFNGQRSNLTQFEVDNKKFYKCSQASEVELDNSVWLIFSDMKYEAFRTEKTANFVRSEHECASDYHSDMVIIAVGCALALLVVIILAAYLIARRRNRQRGYQSV